MFWKLYRGGNWCIIGKPPTYYGVNNDNLQTFLINEKCLIYLISQVEQPPLLNVEIIQNDKTGDDSSIFLVMMIKY